MVTPTNYKVLDTKIFNRGNPVLAVFKGTDQTILNRSEYCYNLNIPIKFLQNAYIDVQLESSVVTANIVDERKGDYPPDFEYIAPRCIA